MKVKEIEYVYGHSLEGLNSLVNKKLDEGWHVSGALSRSGSHYVQMMFLPSEVTELRTIIQNVGEDADAEFSKLFSAGFKLHGHPFVVDGRLCQSMVRFE